MDLTECLTLDGEVLHDKPMTITKANVRSTDATVKQSKKATQLNMIVLFHI